MDTITPPLAVALSTISLKNCTSEIYSSNANFKNIIKIQKICEMVAKADVIKLCLKRFMSVFCKDWSLAALPRGHEPL